MPGRIEHTGKVSQTKSPRRLVETSKVEEDVGLHGCVEVEATYPGGLVEEICAGDLPVGALLSGIADDELDHVHLLDDILEGAHVGVGDLAANGDVAESGQVLEEVVRQFMTRSLAYYALEVFGLDEAVLVLVKVGEALADPLALQPSQQLGELGVGHGVPVLLGANVQRGPTALPIKGQAVLGLVRLPCVVEVVKVDVAGALLVEEAEDDLVLGVGFGEQVLEDGPVVHADLALLVAVGDLEEDAILEPLDLVLEAGTSLACLTRQDADSPAYEVLALGRDSCDELVLVEVVVA